MIKRVVMLVLLVAMSGVLVFGAIHRTESVLASEGRGSGTVEVQASGSEGGSGHGKGAGFGNGNGQGRGGERAGSGDETGGY